MKRGTLEHFKTMRLATLLHCDRADALGLLEALCNHFAPRSAPQGNVGRCTNAEIVAGCGSTRDPDTVVQALLDAGWLEADPTHRLLIHDWKEHADEAVRKWLLRNKLRWLTVSGPCRVTVRTASRQRLDGVRPPRAGKGNGKGSPSSSGSGSVLSGEGVQREGAEMLFAAWNEHGTDLTLAREFNSERRKHALARLEEHTLAEHTAAIDRLNRSNFCRGLNDRGWRADFDWYVRSAAIYTHIVEGKYDNRIRPTDKEARTADALMGFMEDDNGTRPVRQDDRPARASVRPRVLPGPR